MNCLYTIPLCNFGFALRDTRLVFIVKDFGKALLKTKSSPIFFSYKLSERKPLFEIAQWQPPGTERNRRSTGGWVLKPPLTFSESDLTILQETFIHSR